MKKGALHRVIPSYEALTRGYLLKEGLRLLFHKHPTDSDEYLLDLQIETSNKSHALILTKLAEKIARHKKNILNTRRTGLSNARLEAVNNKIKLSIRMAYDFRNMSNMLDMIMLRQPKFGK